jgi:regulatory factor X 1/2/3
MYIPASAQYYSEITTAAIYNNTANTSTQETTEGQLPAHWNGAYCDQQDVYPDTVHNLTATQTACLQTVTADAGVVAHMVSGNTDTKPSSLDGDGHSCLSLTSRTSLSAVEWLLKNFELAEGVSLPRSTLYNHYLRYCKENQLKPITQASLGKVITKVFLRLRTRRIGKRGNNKYHYHGIRIIPGSALSQLPEDENLAVCQQPSRKLRRLLSGSGGTLKIKYEYEQNIKYSVASLHSNSSPQHPNQNLYISDGSGTIPDYPDIEFPPGFYPTEDCTLEDLAIFRRIYREHCAALQGAVVNLKFQTVESLWRKFWRSQDNNNGDEYEEEKYLSKTKLYLLCKCGPVHQFVWRVDCLLYQSLVDALIPDIFRPIPSSVTQAIRNFAKGLESCLARAMTNFPEEMVHIKISAVSVLAQTLERYSSLNHLAHAACLLLQNSSLVDQMLVDFNQVDFRNIQEQASWACQCDESMVQQMEMGFKEALHQQNSLEQWAASLKGVVTQALKPHEGKPNFAKTARQFLLKWSFYSSMVIRDLTFQSAARFASFHLIRLFCDEYMFFLIEHKVALETGETPIAVMGRNAITIRPTGAL